jgi:hypothetical protein
MTHDLQAPELPEPPAISCPWCHETRPTLKQVLMHMESAHHRQWCDLVLYPPIAGERH